MSLTDPLAAAFLDTPQTDDILKERYLFAISAFVRDIIILRFLVNNRL